MSPSATTRLLIVVLLLLVMMASRLMHMREMPLNPDEVWSVWQTLGSPTEIIRWTPYDWPPGYYLLIGGWRALVAGYPLVLRISSVLLFMMGAAFMYRAVRRLGGHEAGVLGMLAYSALGYIILLSLEVRGYALILMLFPLALWLMLRYFDRPGWWRGAALGGTLAGMFYTSLTSFGAFIVLGIVSLIVYGRCAWRWWWPGVVAGVLALPEIINKAGVATQRVEATTTLVLAPLPQALVQLFVDYAGRAVGVWAVLLGLALVLIAYRGRGSGRWAFGFAVWGMGLPLLAYITNPLLGFFGARYGWWIAPGIALMVAWGLGFLPRMGRVLSGGILATLLFVPLPADSPYQIWDRLSPLSDNFAWLRQHLQTGDAVLFNADHTCGAAEEWDYYQRLYFPQGLMFRDSPGGYRRLWVLNPYDQAVLTTQGYMPGRFVGPPGCLFQLYEAPPDPVGILFENGMRFHGVDLMRDAVSQYGPVAYHEGERVQVRLWWSVDVPVALDYSISTYLKRGSNTITQVDGPPQVIYPADAPVETSHWQAGQLYVEERWLQLPLPAAGTYALNMVVYFWADGVPVLAEGVNPDGHLPLQQVTVKSY